MFDLVTALAGRPWAVRSDLAFHVRDMVARGGIGALREFAALKRFAHDEELSARRARAAAEARAAATGSRGGGASIAHVPILGLMTQRGDVVNSAETQSSALAADQALAAAMNPKVDAILLEIDSPGGEVYGVPELWAAIRQSAKLKPVVASVNSVAASAALYAASAATEIVVTPSGEMGSLGVYALHVDESEALKAEGIRVEFVVADESPFKVEGNSTEPLSDEARGEIKKSVNRYMAMFVRDVARGRGLTSDHVREHFGRGRMLSPADAVKVGMATSVGTFGDAVARAAELAREHRGGAGGGRSGGSAALAELHILGAEAAGK